MKKGFGRGRGLPPAEDSDSGDDLLDFRPRTKSISTTLVVSSRGSNSEIQQIQTNVEGPSASTSPVPPKESIWDEMINLEEINRVLLEQYDEPEPDNEMQDMARALPDTTVHLIKPTTRTVEQPQQHLSARQLAIQRGVGIPPKPDRTPEYNESMSAEMQRKVLNEFGRFTNHKLEMGRGWCCITGQTGSGKTTLVTLGFLLENLYKLRTEKRKIFICQPRRIAATSLYDRFLEMAQTLRIGKEIFGMIMGGKSLHFQNSTMAVGTSGWLGVKLIHSPDDIYNYNTIIIDEVHELGQDTELIIGEISVLQEYHGSKYGHGIPSTGASFDDRKRFPNIILISATMDVQVFMNHFRPNEFFTRPPFPTVDDVCVVVDRGVNVKFAVEQYVLEDLPKVFGIDITDILEEFSPTPSMKHGKTYVKKQKPRLLDDVILAMFKTLDKVYTMSAFAKYRDGLILINVPGIHQIQRVIDIYTKDPSVVPIKLNLIPYHGRMTIEEQRSAKKNAKTSVTADGVKVFLGTPVVDTSVTLNNCKIVFDTGLIKNMVLERNSDTDKLTMYWASEVCSTQRKGRTGRQCDGLYVKFLPSKWCKEPVSPELSRIACNSLFLRILRMAKTKLALKSNGFVTKFLRKHLLTKPPSFNIHAAIRFLLNQGLIVYKDDPQLQVYDRYELTEMGDQASSFQLPPQFFRSTCLSQMLLTFENMSIIAACSMEKDLKFFTNGTDSLRLLKFKRDFCDTLPSDTYVMSNIFRLWHKSSNTFRWDKKEKKSKSCRNYTEERNIIDDDLHGCNLSVFPLIDDNLDEVIKEFIKLEGTIRNGVADKWLKDDTEAKLKARATDKLAQICSLCINTPFGTHFQSFPGDHFDPIKNKSVFILNSVILTPAPPENADINEWGPQLQFILSKPSNIMPSIRVDRENNRVIATFPYAPKKYLGLIHPSVKDVLHKSEYHGSMIPHALMYTGTESTEYADEPKLNDWPKCGNFPFQYRTFFYITQWISPHHFGVKPGEAVHNPEFSRISKHLFRMQSSFKPITHEQVIYGQEVVCFNEYCKKDGMWEQQCVRGILRASITQDNLQGLTEHNKNQLLVLVDLIDLGVTREMLIKHLFYFDPDLEEYNYGIPELFTCLPPQAYKVSISTIGPNLSNQWDWGQAENSAMKDMLKNKEYGFKGNVRMHISYASESKKRIIVTDVNPVDKDTSFVEYATKEFNDYARRWDPMVLEDLQEMSPSATFFPTPKNKFVFITNKERCEALLKRAEMEKKSEKVDDGHLRGHIFLQVFSPLEVTFKTIASNTYNDNSRLLISPSSINCRPMDPRLACETMTSEKYDPLIAVGSNLHLTTTMEGETVFLSNETTIGHAIGCIVPILEMLTYPVVEVLIESKQCKATRLYKKQHDGGIEFVTQINFKAVMKKVDIDTIQELRSRINERHCNKTVDMNYLQFRDSFTGVLKKLRQPVEFGPIGNFPYLDATDLKFDGPMKVKIIITKM